MSTIGARIKIRRKQLKLTQKEVAKRVGVSDVAVGYWEKDENEPSGKHLLALADVLKTTAEELIDNKYQVQQPPKTYDVKKFSPESMAVAEAMENCSPETRETFLRILQALQDSDKK